MIMNESQGIGVVHVFSSLLFSSSILLLLVRINKKHIYCYICFVQMKLGIDLLYLWNQTEHPVYEIDYN